MFTDIHTAQNISTVEAVHLSEFPYPHKIPSLVWFLAVYAWLKFYMIGPPSDAGRGYEKCAQRSAALRDN
jgi:hypothetical protein